MLKKSIRPKILRNMPSKLIRSVPDTLLNFKIPARITVEVTNACNLQCPLCPTPKLRRKRGFMKFQAFQKMIDDMRPHFPKAIYFSYAGEPLLNEDIFKMVKYVSQQGIETVISTNVTRLDRFSFDEIFESRLDKLIVCLDGASKETHEMYRRGSDFEAVKTNIRNLCQSKRERGIEKPQIVLQTVIMRSNESEIPDILKMAENLGVDALNLKTTHLGFLPKDSKETQQLAEKYLPVNSSLRRYVLNNSQVSFKKREKGCSSIINTVVLWNGDVSICCQDYEGLHIVGNVFRDGGILQIFQNRKYSKYRKKMLTRVLDICQSCNQTSDYISQTIFFQ